MEPPDQSSYEGSADVMPTFRATRTVCVLLAIPTTTEPCFTASDAYSTWKIRPCGELFARFSGVLELLMVWHTMLPHRYRNCS